MSLIGFGYLSNTSIARTFDQASAQPTRLVPLAREGVLMLGDKINVAIIGVGNCAACLVQGV